MEEREIEAGVVCTDEAGAALDLGDLRSAVRPVAAGDPSRLDGLALAETARRALDAGLRRVKLVAWRDLDDPEAGGSELHAHRIAASWADAGLDVIVRTSAVAGQPAEVRRDGYRAVRRSGRYRVFPDSAVDGLLHPRAADAVVEVWNGMPFLSPAWARVTRLVVLHHVHAEMWGMVLPPRLARLGELVERRLAPPLYRRTRVVTLSESSRQEIVSMLGLRPGLVDVVAPGVDSHYRPGGTRSPVPLVLSVGRLVPVKRFPMLVDVLAQVRRRVPTLRAVIVGEGYARPEVEAAVRRVGAGDWLELRGRCDEQELLDLYRRAWVLASASQREGWGMTVTEAAACGTPAVATRIAGHLDAVIDGESGLLVEDEREMVDGLVAALTDELLVERLRRGALQRVAGLSWAATANRTLEALLLAHGARHAVPAPVVRPARRSAGTSPAR